MFSLQNKIAVITGGGSGIGKAMALLFTKMGAITHIVELNQDAALNTLIEIEQQGGTAFSVRCDVSNQREVIHAFGEIGIVDILINNAGVAHVGTIEQTSVEDFDRLLSVNVKGAYNCMYAILPLMKARGSGIIINMSSIAAHVGITDRFAYSMSKGAIHAMSLSVARDYLHHGIRCNTISPARIHTPFVDGFIAHNYPEKKEEMFDKLSHSQPIGRMGTPEEVAALALFLCSEEAGFITGCDYPIDGGFIHLNN